MRSPVSAKKVLTPRDREDALSVIEAVYLQEKRWIRDPDSEIPADVAGRRDQSWFLVSVGGEPAGVIRLVYDPPLEMPAELGVALEPDVDLEGLRRRGRFVDIGRFMIVPRQRRNIRVVLRLMRAAIVEVVSRGYTHFVTDVFEDDPHSPYLFHTRVLGFERIGTHRYGELACASTRIILILDIASAYRRLQKKENKVFRELGEGVGELLEARLLAPTA
ncbi:MAG TPA: GNAT family N-acetyltransferase [Thermoanaerobaculia bacterium]|nr:GNAT family N-acetyltransferase [Thermoanaerobaculia bacterium]